MPTNTIRHNLKKMSARAISVYIHIDVQYIYIYEYVYYIITFGLLYSTDGQIIIKINMFRKKGRKKEYCIENMMEVTRCKCTIGIHNFKLFK